MKSDKPIKQLIDEFLEDQDVREKSRYQYKVNLDQWLRYCITQVVNIRAPRRADVINYKSTLLSENKSPSTIDGYLTTVRKFYGWLEGCGIYENIAAGVHSPKKYRGHRKDYLTPDQVTAMLKAMPRNSLSEIRNYAIVNMMVRTGIRRVELWRMNVRDIYESGGRWVMKIQRKGHWEKDQILGLTSKVVDPVFEYLSLRKSAKEDEPLFINHSKYNPNERINPDYVSTMIKGAIGLIGVHDKKITGHSLRHTAAITAIRSGATLQEVQEMLGHRNIETTKIYLSAIDEETRYDNPAVRAIELSY